MHDLDSMGRCVVSRVLVSYSLVSKKHVRTPAAPASECRSKIGGRLRTSSEVLRGRLHVAYVAHCRQLTVAHSHTIAYRSQTIVPLARITTVCSADRFDP